MCSARGTEEEEEDFGACLGLGLAVGGGGGGGGGFRCHGEPALPLQLLDLSRFKEGRGGSGSGESEQPTSKKTEKGTSTRSDAAGDGRSLHGPSPSRDDGGQDQGRSRKKLRLTCAAVGAARGHLRRPQHTIPYAQKHELARQANLSAQQVEVWFKNRRAKTKLKQTEVGCELLRQWCGSLADENRRLKHELTELQRPSATATSSCCPVCGECDQSRGERWRD